MFSIHNIVDTDIDDVYGFVCLLENETLDKAYFTMAFKENIRCDNNIYLMARYQHQSVGFISCHGQTLLHHTGRVFEIQELYIVEAYRNRGAGRVLLLELQKRLTEMNCASLEVSSNVKRSDAHRFYLQNGFNSTHMKFTKSNIDSNSSFAHQ